MKYLGIFSSILFACTGENIIEKQDNSQPSILIVSHSDGAEVQDGYAEAFRATVSDDDDIFTDLSVAWYVGEEVVCDWEVASAAGESACSIVFSTEDSSVIAEVRDPLGAGGRAELSILVLPTEAPIAEILSPLSSRMYYSNQLIQFSGLVSDLEDDLEDLVITWTSTLDGNIAIDTTPDSSGAISDYAYLSEGQHALELHVEDSSGKTTADEVVVLVGGANSIPQCGISSPENMDTYIYGSTVPFTGTASDADIPANELEVTWTSDKDGVFGTQTPTSGGNINLAYASLTTNTHTITLSVEDETGAICSDEIFLVIGTPPSIVISNPLANEIYSVGETIIFQASVSDTEDQLNSLGVVWTSSLDGEIHNASANSQGLSQFPNASLSTGLHSISASVTDSSGLLADDFITLRINTPPTAPTVSISPDPAYTTASLIASASGSTDADGGTVTYSYQWFENSVLTTYTGTVIPSSELAVGEVWSIRVTPNDGYVDGTYAETSVTISNSAPVLGAISLNPPDPGLNETLVCASSATDIDGGTPALSFAFSNQSSGATLSATSTTSSSASLDLSSVTAVLGDVISCSVTATDVDGGSATNSTSVMIVNTSPIFDQMATITPNTGVVMETALECSAVASDPDDGVASLSYIWKVNGIQVAIGSTWTVISSDASAGDSVSCTAIAIDFTGNSTTSNSISVLVENSIPEIGSVYLNDLSPDTNGVLTATVLGTSDLDGDTITHTYEWHILDASSAGVNIIVSTGSGSSFSTLNGAFAFDRDDEIYVLVTPNDGTDDGLTVESDHATVLNTAPTQPTIAISSSVTPPMEGVDDLTCSVTGASTDLDGNAITYSYEWLDNVGFTQQTTSNSLSTSDLYLGSGTSSGTWTCLVSAFDGADSSTIASAQITVDTDWPGAVTFTNCSSSGTSGPSQSNCNTEYSGTELDGFVTVTSGLQYWTAPFSGTYAIEAYGAEGGTSTGESGGTNYAGGLGSYITGEFNVTAGDTLIIQVGQIGNNSNCGSGGGGGTFVHNGSQLLLIAGGGGGGFHCNALGGRLGGNGQAGTSGGNGVCSPQRPSSTGGTNGNGGISTSYGTGGSGYYSAGTGSCSMSAYPANGGTPNGGFGGGGCHYTGCCGNSGAGGGYSGGSVGSSDGCAGGGGGSYNIGSNPTNLSGINSSYGFVVINLL